MTFKTLIVLFAYLVAGHAWAGGELGNGKFEVYRNSSLMFETLVPSDWRRDQTSDEVNFAANLNLGSVDVEVQSLPKVQTVDDLKEYLSTSNSENWAAIEVDRRPGFKSVSESGSGILMLLKQPGQVMTVRFQESIQTHALVSTILDHMKLIGEESR